MHYCEHVVRIKSECGSRYRMQRMRIKLANNCGKKHNILRATSRSERWSERGRRARNPEDTQSGMQTTAWYRRYIRVIARNNSERGASSCLRTTRFIRWIYFRERGRLLSRLLPLSIALMRAIRISQARDHANFIEIFSYP